MNIWVEHEVSDDPKYCSCATTHGERTVCSYHKIQFNPDKFVDRHQGRCMLFKKWLRKDFYGSVKCYECSGDYSEG